MSDEQCQMILDASNRRSDINIGRVVKIIALSNNYDGIQTILDKIFAFEDEHVSLNRHLLIQYCLIFSVLTLSFLICSE